MILRFRFGHWKFVFALTPIQVTQGLQSNLADGNHILMWDFDDVYLHLVMSVLRGIQRDYELPQIYVFKSSAGDHYLALCLLKCDWWLTKHIVSSARYIHEEWFRAGVSRGHFTIRIGIKDEFEPQPIAILPSEIPETVKINELVNYEDYEAVKHAR